jgi:hypothetical protein
MSAGKPDEAAMIALIPLCTMTLGLGKAVEAGSTPAGQRMASPASPSI